MRNSAEAEVSEKAGGDCSLAVAQRRQASRAAVSHMWRWQRRREPSMQSSERTTVRKIEWTNASRRRVIDFPLCCSASKPSNLLRSRIRLQERLTLLGALRSLLLSRSSTLLCSLPVRLARPPPAPAMPALLHADVASFASSLKLLHAAPPPRAVLFVSGLDPASNQSWCPDCRRAQPAVERAATDGDASLLVVDVGDRASWKSAGHPFRVDAALKLTCIPTLLAAKGAGEDLSPRLDLEEAASSEEVYALTAAFFKSE